ncbi:hypothetical protein HMP0721_2435 [Pseudoramibacter alactolyticus ATCC 23263]|uniref:Rad50/SbcC-type AAA domain-containing protein n=1 Tax=Pseudoramibacter alactolyticus ATCC 23263 TaxID=887929 RepID=E6MK99_9FIRM|nr:AAA family ATPase [Pseudoramibacter alactolyticus]EFV00618.1 hypothetical protein HMP0721_2435 [Pseudoramibacter alactolyticus ATCC 23263]
MSRFHISQIAASGENVEYSSVSFKDGVNFIVGPSNTGKSYIIGCIDFLFGGKEVPFSLEDTGYDTVSMTLESEDGDTLTATRKIEEGENGDKGSNTVAVSSSLPGIKQEYKVSTYEYSDLLLRLVLGIEEHTKIIGTQAPKDENLTIRTIFHFFFINEDNIFGKRTAFDNPGHSKITASLTSLLYLINGDNLQRYLPDVSVEDLEKRATRKAGVISYLNDKIQALSEQKKKLEESVAAEADVDVEAKIEEFVAEIERIERQIVDASEESRKLLAQIFDLNAKLQEARYLGDRYKALRTQYNSDIKRLNFIVEGDEKGKLIRHKTSCPFCGHDMDEEEESRASYVDSAKAELARIKLQLEDLKITEGDTTHEIKTMESRLKELNAQNNTITRLLNQELRPHAAELRKAVAEYKRIQQLRQELQSVAYMSTELGADVFEKENEEDETATKFDAKKVFDTNIWKELSDSINQMIKDCAYTGSPNSYLKIETADVVVGKRHKRNQGKGYRAYLNTIMLFNLMKYLENKGKYPSHLLVLDSPILSLKEKKYNIAEKEKATASMREALIQYIIDNCGQNQVIIAENKLPENVNYTDAHRIIFSMEDGDGLRYGFLKSVRN